LKLKWRRIQSLQATFSDIQTAVTDNAKQRFSLRPNPDISPAPGANDTDPSHWLIRANQGHSIAVESAALLKPITLEAGNVPDIVVHGTYYAFYPAIVASGGLKNMGRNHVHFSTGLPEDKQGVISGMRRDAEILVYIDIRKSLEDGGVLWWLSDNGVVLTEGDENGLVGTKYWKKVEGRRQDIGVLWQDGEQIAELPQSVKGRKAPSGKGPKGRREGEKANRKDHKRDGARTGMKEHDALGGGDGLAAEQDGPYSHNE
jgi:2'-phosphotransferase